MKKIVLMIMATLLMTIGYAKSAEKDFHEPKVAGIASQIYSMLEKNAIPDDIRGSRAEVRVAVDDGNYLRILSIETDNQAFATYIRSTIDFKRLTKGTFEKGIVYRIPIEVKN